MAQSQPLLPQAPQRTFSPAQQSPSPAATHSAFALPPNKRARTEGTTSQPGSPYPVSPYTMSPPSVGTPPASAASPQYSQPMPTSAHVNYSPAYTNGHLSPSIQSPDVRHPSTPPIHTPQPNPVLSASEYTTAMMAPIAATSGGLTQPSPMPGVMGPPQRPADRPAKDYQYDVTDTLAGTGIDLRAEEQYMSELYSNAFEVSADTRTGFPQHPPGSKSSFYGAGPANQPAQQGWEMDQKAAEIQAAERAWNEAAMRLAVQRTQEINDPFLLVALLHRRAEKIAQDFNLGLNLETRNPNHPSMGKFKLPEHFPQPTVTVTSTPGPEATTLQTTGSFIPQESFLVDQIALLSIATKQRVRELVEDANGVACNRQKTSHGDVPEDWANAADPLNREQLEPMDGATLLNEDRQETEQRATNPLKRSSETAGMPNGVKVAKMPKIASYLILTMREAAKQEREWEEARLRKRQRRKDGVLETGSTSTRSNSIAPGTPGSIAPESEKPMTKKELKKSQALKAAEASSHANQNMTSSMFAGLGGKSGLFGKKKQGKTYDWMNVGRAGSGASTPTKAAAGSIKGVSAGPGTPAVATNNNFTTEGRNRLGTWREDREKGRGIQLRDWVTVLERDGREAAFLQHAYNSLDASQPR